MNRRNLPDEVRYKFVDGIKRKLCVECEEYFPMNNDHFYNNKSNRKDGLNTYCIPCVFKRAKKWVDKNPDKYKEQKLRKVAVKTDIQRQRSRDAARRNREEGYQKQWRINNRDKLRVYNSHREKNKKHEINRTEWSNCKEYFSYECAYCGLSEEVAKQETGHNLHKEHVGHTGANDLSNCVPSCRNCNSQKWTKGFEEWYNNSNPVYGEERYKKIIKWLEEDYKLYIEQITI